MIGSRFTSKKVVLDLYCCQGGAGRGYQDLGYLTVGVDIVDQPRYVGEMFHQADAVEYVHEHVEWIRQNVAFVHASPPCQRYSKAQKIQGREHPDLIGVTRDVLEFAGVPYVIENVEAARSELRNPIMLCGTMFGMKTYRHRLFETSFPVEAPGHPEHVAKLAKMGRPRKPGEFAHYVGNFSGVAEARTDMEMPWATRDGIREAIPPAYTRYIGEQFLLMRG